MRKPLAPPRRPVRGPRPAAACLLNPLPPPSPPALAGWILFLVFAGWGMMAAPIDWIHQYMRRPKSVITKSEFIGRARGLAQRAKEIRVRRTAALPRCIACSACSACSACCRQ
jgi:hypothetical protein